MPRRGFNPELSVFDGAEITAAGEAFTQGLGL
jgi:hypothetical protein